MFMLRILFKLFDFNDKLFDFDKNCPQVIYFNYFCLLQSLVVCLDFVFMIFYY